MNVFDFFKQDELDDAPEDDALAFIQLISIAQRRLAERTERLDETNQWDSHVIDESRHAFMNVAIALAKTYKIEPFAGMEVPRAQDFGHADDMQFKADLDHYMTQLVVGNSIRARRESVLLPPPSKQKIRDYLNAIRKVIDEATDLPEAKRAALLKKLADFEAALDKQRLNVMAMTAFVIAVLGLPGALGASYELVAGLTHRLLREVAEAKVIGDENRELPPTEPRLALTPPRKSEPTRPGRKTTPDSLDDEIPF